MPLAECGKWAHQSTERKAADSLAEKRFACMDHPWLGQKGSQRGGKKEPPSGFPSQATELVGSSSLKEMSGAEHSTVQTVLLKQKTDTISHFLSQGILF